MMSTSRCFNWSLEPWLPGETEILFDIHRTIELIPEMQGHGLGTSILRSLLQEADTANVPVRLQVLKVNTGAQRWCEALGFGITGETDTHHDMERLPRSR